MGACLKTVNTYEDLPFSKFKSFESTTYGKSWKYKTNERKTQELTNFKVGPKEILQIWSLDHIEIQSKKKKSEDISCFIFLPLFCIKECKDVLARHKAFFHIPNFQVVQGKHILLFFFLLRERERERERENWL